MSIKLIDDNTIEVISREGSNKKLLSMKRHTNTYYKYNAPKAIFTSATVGGITTGGVDIIGPSYSLQNGGRTDRFDLWYEEHKTIKLINKIRLSPSDTSIAASDSRLKKFLEGNTLLLKYQLTDEMDQNQIRLARDVYSKTGDTNQMLNVAQSALSKTLLTESDMSYVYSWICTPTKTERVQMETEKVQKEQNQAVGKQVGAFLFPLIGILWCSLALIGRFNFLGVICIIIGIICIVIGIVFIKDLVKGNKRKNKWYAGYKRKNKWYAGYEKKENGTNKNYKKHSYKSPTDWTGERLKSQKQNTVDTVKETGGNTTYSGYKVDDSEEKKHWYAGYEKHD